MSHNAHPWPGTALAVLLPVFLAGCPYIWEPPELSGRDGDIVGETPTPPTPPPDTDDTDPGDTDTDTGDTDTGDTDTGDTDTGDTDTGDTDTGDTDTDTDLPPVGVPPVIADVTATYGFGEVELGFRVTDLDGDIPGGAVRLSVDGGAPTLHVVPGDLDTWDGTVGTLVLQVGTSCNGLDRQYDLTPEDASGLVGNTLGAHVTVGGHQTTEQVGAHPLGAIDLPAVICGQLSNGNDVDAASFEPNQGGTWRFGLTWPGNSDRDARLLDDQGAELATATSQSKPDTMQAQLTAASAYEVEVSSPVAGPGGNWTLVIHE